MRNNLFSTQDTDSYKQSPILHQPRIQTTPLGRIQTPALRQVRAEGQSLNTSRS